MLDSAVIAYIADIFGRFIFVVGIILQKLALNKVEEENKLLKSASKSSRTLKEGEIAKQENTACEGPVIKHEKESKKLEQTKQKRVTSTC